MTRFALTWAANVAALWVAVAVVGGVRADDDAALTLILAALLFSVVNLLVKPVVTVLALPLIVLTLGIALFFVNLLMLVLTSALVPGFEIDGFWSAAGATVIVWAVNVALAGVRRRLERD